MNPEADAMAELLVEENVKIVTTGAGSPAKYMEKWKSNEMMIIPEMCIRDRAYGATDVCVYKAGGLCSYYAERGGIILSCETK